jgi:(p)ppGpp synthase/HD superfamily hydrolase
MTIYIKACSWAIRKHSETNHLYDGRSYDAHLWQVVDIAKMFIHYIPEEDRDKVLAACWLHDTIEDCRVTYNDLKQEFGYHIAEIVYALTNEKGRTRKERANDKYYEGIRDVRYAAFVKICDRIANVKYSSENKGSMLSKYKDEASAFYKALGNNVEYLPMWSYMESFFTK